VIPGGVRIFSESCCSGVSSCVSICQRITSTLLGGSPIAYRVFCLVVLSTVSPIVCERRTSSLPASSDTST
jgi:hypothetical protein